MCQSKTLVIPRLTAIGKKDALLFIFHAHASHLANLALQIDPQLQPLAFVGDALIPLIFSDCNRSSFIDFPPCVDDSAEAASATAVRDAALRELQAAQEEVAALKQQVQGLQSELAAAREAATAAEAKLQEGSETSSHSEREASHSPLSQAESSKGNLWKAVQLCRGNAAAQPNSES